MPELNFTLNFVDLAEGERWELGIDLARSARPGEEQ